MVGWLVGLVLTALQPVTDMRSTLSVVNKLAPSLMAALWRVEGSLRSERAALGDAPAVNDDPRL
jgi:hypothetical protein